MKALLISAIVGASLLSAQAIAAPATSEKQANTAVQFRKAVFQLVRSNMGPLGAMAKGNIPFDPQVMETNAMRMKQLAAMAPDYFVSDTREFALDTGAKDAVWTNLEDFNSKAQDLVNAASNLEAVAKAKDEANYRKAIGAVGATCKACHDDYKKD